MTEIKAKRGRPAKVKTDGLQIETKAKAEAETQGGLTVKVAGAIHDGEGGFYPVGAKITPVDDVARASLIAKGLAE